MARIRTPRTLRANLALTYAGIAALTAVLLGGILVSVLAGYYARAEDRYLAAGFTRVSQMGLPAVDSPDADLQRWVLNAAILAQARVQLYTTDDVLVADSGSLRDLDPARLGDLDEPRGHDRERLPGPLGEGFFDRGDAPTSSRSLTISPGRPYEGYLVFSEAPASGADALRSVGQAWAFAALLAVVAAALAGAVVSSRISRPIVVLTDAADRMHSGDLAARADVRRDDELGHLAESFNAMAGRIESTFTALRRFVADAAHQIGTPLTALQADLELAEREASSEDERRLVMRALGQARRLEDLSRDLLRLSRIESGENAGTAVPVDLVRVARAAADAVASRAEQAGLTFEVELGEESLTVLGDAPQLQIALDNLLDNALKFTPEGGSIGMSARREGDSARVSISDTGVGIPEGEHDRVFGRFHRARNVAAYPGSGLGLAIVRATVERMGGSVAFASGPGGTTFTLRMPLASGDDTR